MFNKLKEMAGNAVTQKAVEKLAPEIDKQLDIIKGMKASDIKDDALYQTRVVAPAWLAVSGAMGGAQALMPNLKDRFAETMLQLRNELLIFNGDKVSLVPDAKQRLPNILKAAIESST